MGHLKRNTFLLFCSVLRLLCVFAPAQKAAALGRLRKVHLFIVFSRSVVALVEFVPAHEAPACSLARYAALLALLWKEPAFVLRGSAVEEGGPNNC